MSPLRSKTREDATALRDALDALGQLRAALEATGDGEEWITIVLRLSGDLEAALFHSKTPADDRPLLLAMLGGTGTGKSTLANRLCGVPDGQLTATSFRRTFTSGPVAIAGDAHSIPMNWLGLPQTTIEEEEQLPARGVGDSLVTIVRPHALDDSVVLIDTPDLDGDTPEHHRQADRVFRWAEAILFVTTPEKYQMPELLAYYRLAGRYRVPSLFVMNKVDEIEAPNDWQQQLEESGVKAGTIYVVARDDAGTSAPPGRDLAALSDALQKLRRPTAKDRREGVRARSLDAAGRVQDQLVAPLLQLRSRVETARGRMQALVRPEAGVNVHPLTRHLQRRLQQQSVLYLMGPGRILDRVRSVPSLVARLPRHTWDLVTKGRTGSADETVPPEPVGAPDFRGELMDALNVVHSRIEDVLTDAGLSMKSDRWKIDPIEAGDIATAELDGLKRWLEERWNAKPRDTRMLQKLVQTIPGGKHLPRLSETAPYLLAATCATTNALLGPVDLAVLSGYSLVVWLGERMSNEVAAKTRETNRRIAERFSELCERQVARVVQRLEQMAPSRELVERLGDAAARLAGEEG